MQEPASFPQLSLTDSKDSKDDKYDKDDKNDQQGVAGNVGGDGLLGLCEGKCSSGADCAEGLVCYAREYGDPVPGCSGTPRGKSVA